MNKNKIIFSILGIILFVAIVVLVINLNSSTKETTKPASTPGDFTIWLFGDDHSKFQEYLTQFKNDNGKYGSKNIVVESFSDYQIYTQTLHSAFLQGIGPDIFVLNNNENSILENQILGIDPNFISPNDFRKAYKGVFGDDLITTLETDATVEFLKGIPIGYQTLGVYFNRRYFKSDMFSTWTSLNSSLNSIVSKNSNIVPIALGNGNVAFSDSILMQIFLSLGDKNIIELSRNTITQGLQTYMSFGERKGENAYNALTNSSDTISALEYFSRGDVVALIGYPRLLNEIEKRGYQKNFLLATPFPQFIGKDKKTLVDYNYFAVNKDTQNRQLANDLLAFMVSTPGVETYLDMYPYYLPALLELEDDMLEKKINPNFNIVYKDFIDRESVLSSFKTGDKNMFTSLVVYTLGLDSNHLDLFEKSKTNIVCGVNKFTNFTNLSASCK